MQLPSDQKQTDDFQTCCRLWGLLFGFMLVMGSPYQIVLIIGMGVILLSLQNGWMHSCVVATAIVFCMGIYQSTYKHHSIYSIYVQPQLKTNVDFVQVYHQMLNQSMCLWGAFIKK